MLVLQRIKLKNAIRTNALSTFVARQLTRKITTLENEADQKECSLNSFAPWPFVYVNGRKTVALFC